MLSSDAGPAKNAAPLARAPLMLVPRQSAVMVSPDGVGWSTKVVTGLFNPSLR